MNINKIIQKYHSGERLLKKEETYLRKKLVEKADRVFSIFIRSRDKERNCVSYGAEKCKNIIQNACHRIPRERYSHRWDENNVYGGCSSCNGFNKQEHQKFFTIFQTKKHGQEWVDKQLRDKNKIKPTIDYLLSVIDKYDKKQNSSIEK